MALIDDIKQAAEEVFPRTVATRRDLHAHPELAFEEFRTAETVTERLKELGVDDLQTNVAQTGVVGYIKGKQDGPTLALRADMDALPILEANDVPYKSQNPGKMHACGHDAHTSSLLSTAEILTKIKRQIPGTIKLVFQPSEEQHPGGASVMVKEGVLEGVKGILGQHVMPIIPAGKVGVRSGMYMASADELYLTVRGKGGHGAQPHTTVDPVVIAAQIILALQTVVSRVGDPRIPCVLTIGKVVAEGATNVIPPKVDLVGTFRTFNETWRADAHKQIEQTARGIAESMGGALDLEIRKGYPVLYNDERMSEVGRKAMEAYVGPENVEPLDLWMASEDFAYYTQNAPGFFYRLGTRNEARGIVHGLHTPQFDIEEEAFKTSTGLMAWLAIKELEEMGD